MIVYGRIIYNEILYNVHLSLTEYKKKHFYQTKSKWLQSTPVKWSLNIWGLHFGNMINTTIHIKPNQFLLYPYTNLHTTKLVLYGCNTYPIIRKLNNRLDIIQAKFLQTKRKTSLLFNEIVHITAALLYFTIHSTALRNIVGYLHFPYIYAGCIVVFYVHSKMGGGKQIVASWCVIPQRVL